MNAIAALVPKTGSVADVGTDHGFIPVWLVQEGHIGRLTAADINIGPLNHARQTAAEYGLEDKISFILCDGLAGLSPADADTIIIAGMGGETIAAILSAAPWTSLPAHFLILQPMTKAPFLREWLFENGYRAVSEQLVRDGEIYEIICAVGGSDSPYSPAELLTGHRALIHGDALFCEKLNTLISKKEKAILGLSASLQSEEQARLNQLQKALDGLLEIKEELNV
ncbi:MAG: class I SAM-dependent methyltransferase [Oscillospiraceae bacterium]